MQLLDCFSTSILFGIKFTTKKQLKNMNEKFQNVIKAFHD